MMARAKEVGYHLATIGLAPILVAQGHFVRRMTPKLPEPPGDRQGLVGSGALLRLLIVGDSAAAGVGAASQQEAMAGQLVRALSLSYTVKWRVLARTGHTIDDVLQAVQIMPSESFDVVVTSVGVNDATAGTAVRAWQDALVMLMDLVQSRTGAQHLLLSGMPPMHLFPALPQPLRWYMGWRASRLDWALRQFAQQHACCQWVPTDLPVSRALLAPDGFHPNALAYSVWAQQLAQVVQLRVAVVDPPSTSWTRV